MFLGQGGGGSACVSQSIDEPGSGVCHTRVPCVPEECGRRQRCARGLTPRPAMSVKVSDKGDRAEVAVARLELT